MFNQQLRWKLILGAGSLLLILSAESAAAVPKAKDRDSGWTLVWSDEFNGPDGSAPDSKKWTYDIGVDGDGWGNNELEYYTNSRRNIAIRSGMLVITAVREKYTGPSVAPTYLSGRSEGKSPSEVTRDYTSARIKTQGLFAETYGRFEARIKIPRGQGMWPAFWMLGANIDKTGWPACGEIDIMENIGKEPSKVHGSIHGPGPSGSGADDMTAIYTLPQGERFSDAFHVFAVEWEPKVIRFYVDNHLYETVTPAGLPHGTGWVFNHPFFLLLNLAIGGDWPGNPDKSTHFPQEMLVDYVRVYARK
ncbi:MAG TPA: glycoside hydrolase family 16 protein [Terriglobia bacterium]|nr:glycoside hydrolase family 16 protein [Terriglobia bacterium]